MADNAAAKAARKTDLEARAKSEPTDLHKAFAEWLFIQTGVKPDLKTVQLVCSMRMDFQQSPENQAALKAKRDKVASAKAKKDEAAKAKKLALLAKLKAELEGDEPKAEEAPAAEEETVEATEEKAAEEVSADEAPATETATEPSAEHNVTIKVSPKARTTFKATIHTDAEGKQTAHYTDRKGVSVQTGTFTRV